MAAVESCNLARTKSDLSLTLDDEVEDTCEGTPNPELFESDSGIMIRNRRPKPCLSPSSSSKKKQEKSVEFCSSMKVVLIPSRADYNNADLLRHLWWNSRDYRHFQESAFTEIKFLSVFEGINLEDARNMLYQPSFDRDTSVHVSVPETLPIRLDSPSRDAKFDESSLSLCVPLKDALPLPSDDKFVSDKKGDWINEVGIGAASIVAFSLVIIPAIFSLERWMHTGGIF